MVYVAILDVGQSWQKLQLIHVWANYCSTFNADNSAIIHDWILTKKMFLKSTDMEIT